MHCRKHSPGLMKGPPDKEQPENRKRGKHKQCSDHHQETARLGHRSPVDIAFCKDPLKGRHCGCGLHRSPTPAAKAAAVVQLGKAGGAEVASVKRDVPCLIWGEESALSMRSA